MPFVNLLPTLRLATGFGAGILIGLVLCSPTSSAQSPSPCDLLLTYKKLLNLPAATQPEKDQKQNALRILESWITKEQGDTALKNLQQNAAQHHPTILPEPNVGREDFAQQAAHRIKSLRPPYAQIFRQRYQFGMGQVMLHSRGQYMAASIFDSLHFYIPQVPAGPRASLPWEFFRNAAKKDYNLTSHNLKILGETPDGLITAMIYKSGANPVVDFFLVETRVLATDQLDLQVHALGARARNYFFNFDEGVPIVENSATRKFEWIVGAEKNQLATKVLPDDFVYVPGTEVERRVVLHSPPGFASLSESKTQLDLWRLSAEGQWLHFQKKFTAPKQRIQLSHDGRLIAVLEEGSQGLKNVQWLQIVNLNELEP